MKLTFLLFACSVLATAQSKPVSIRPDDLQPRNVAVEEVTFKGRTATRVTDKSTGDLPDGQRIAVLKNIEFQDGIIEFELAGDRMPGASEAARGFTGFAFRVSPDGKSYNAFYLRPYNGRSQDQAQRNHSAQYISIPEFGWRKLRETLPSVYEAYVDLLPSEWTKVKIEVRGNTAKLYVHGAEQPTLIINDLKGGNPKGGLALFIDPSSLSHFSNVRISK